MATITAAQQEPIVSRDRVIDVLRTELRTVVTVQRSRTVEQISAASGVPVRAIRSYMANDPGEAREPCLSSALSVAAVLGSRAVNAIVALIGYSATAHDEADAIQPMQVVADALGHFAIIGAAAADNRIDHTEERAVMDAADQLIATVLPLSRAGRAA